MFRTLIERWRSRPTGKAARPSGQKGQRQSAGIPAPGKRERPGDPGTPAPAPRLDPSSAPSDADPPKTDTPPPTLPPGLTLREYLNDRIRGRSRWLEGRYGRDKDGVDHGALLDSLLAPASSVIRRPPLAARRLLQENRGGTASLGTLAEIIEGDPALLQSVLKHANSAFYATGAGGNPIMSVPPALHRIGSRGIEIVVMSHLVEGSLCRPGEGLDELAGEVWSHMLRVAPLARALSSGFGVNPDEAYAIGLLHDVGKLVLFNRIADMRKRLRRPVDLAPGFIPAALRELHEPLGGLALMEWGMGDTAALAVAHHHRTPPPQPPSPICEVVFLAERLDLLTIRGVDASLEPIWAEAPMTARLERVAPIWDGLRPRTEEAPGDGSAALGTASPHGEGVPPETTEGTPEVDQEGGAREPEGP